MTRKNVHPKGIFGQKSGYPGSKIREIFQTMKIIHK
jgi:hypothetical protein